jgi:hypothetical protein
LRANKLSELIQTKLPENNQELANKIAVCFATFDEKIGPISLYHKNIENDLANEIAVKVMVGSLSLHSQADVDLNGESIIPFPTTQKIAFSYFFIIPDPEKRGGVQSCALIIILPENQQLKMYRYAPFFSTQCKKVSRRLINHYPFGDSLSKKLRQRIDSLLEIESLHIEIEEFYAARKITISQSEQKGSVKFLNKIIRKHLDKAILAIILGNPVVVTGSKVMTELAIASLALFSPHKEIHKVFWTTQIVQADLIGTTKNLAKAYDEAVIVDLDKGKVEGGVSSKYCKKLLKELKSENERIIKRKIEEKITDIISKVNLLIELVMKEKLTKEEISNIAPTFSSEQIDIVIYIAKKMNPMFAKKIESLGSIITREISTRGIFL